MLHVIWITNSLQNDKLLWQIFTSLKIYFASLAGVRREIILYRLQKQLFPERWEAFSVHLRQYPLLQNPSVLLEGSARKDVHDRTQCNPSVSWTNLILKYFFCHWTILFLHWLHLLCLHKDMCPGTSMKQYRGCTTSQGTEI